MIMRHGASGAIAPQRLNCLVVAERQTWLRVEVLGGYMDGLTSACSFLPAGSACSFLSEICPLPSLYRYCVSRFRPDAFLPFLPHSCERIRTCIPMMLDLTASNR